MARAGCASTIVGIAGMFLAILLFVTGGQWLQLHVRAGDILDRWARSVAAAGGPSFTITGEPARQVGDWEAAFAGDGKAALMAGAFEVRGDLPLDAPPDQVISWPDGSRESVHLLAAGRAIAGLRTEQAATCGCTPLRVNGARLTTAPVGTSRGVVELPVWELTLDVTAVRVQVVAVAGAPVASQEALPDGGSWILYPDYPDGVEVWPDDQTLLVSFTGGSAEGGCVYTYDVEPVESSTGVVLLIHEHQCLLAWLPLPRASVGYPRTAIGHLAKPLGTRALLEPRFGTTLGYKRHTGPVGPYDAASAVELVRAWITAHSGGEAVTIREIGTPRAGQGPQGRQVWLVDATSEITFETPRGPEVHTSRMEYAVDVEMGNITRRQLHFTVRTPGPSSGCDDATAPPALGSAAPSPACTRGAVIP